MICIYVCVFCYCLSSMIHPTPYMSNAHRSRPAGRRLATKVVIPSLQLLHHGAMTCPPPILLPLGTTAAVTVGLRSLWSLWSPEHPATLLHCLRRTSPCVPCLAVPRPAHGSGLAALPWSCHGVLASRKTLGSATVKWQERFWVFVTIRPLQRTLTLEFSALVVSVSLLPLLIFLCLLRGRATA